MKLEIYEYLLILFLNFKFLKGKNIYNYNKNAVDFFSILDMENFLSEKIINGEKQTNSTRLLDGTINYCDQMKDCFNCSAFSDKIEDCNWKNGKCSNANSYQKIENWWNYFDPCSNDINSIIKTKKYCGNFMHNLSLPYEIELPKNNYLYGAKNLFCSWFLDLDKFTEEGVLLMNYNDNILDYDSILIVKANYKNGKSIKKTFSSRLDWVLKDITSMEIYYYTLRTFEKKPFTLKINFQELSVNTNIVVLVTIGVLILICIFLIYVISKCSMRYRRLRHLNIANSNEIQPQENNQIQNDEMNSFNNINFEKNNLEILNLVLESTFKGVKYQESLNKFKINCTICMEEFETDVDIIKLYCKHIFHFECLKNLMIKNRHKSELKCPNCKNEVLLGSISEKNKSKTNIFEEVENHSKNHNENFQDLIENKTLYNINDNVTGVNNKFRLTNSEENKLNNRCGMENTHNVTTVNYVFGGVALKEKDLRDINYKEAHEINAKSVVIKFKGNKKFFDIMESSKISKESQKSKESELSKDRNKSGDENDFNKKFDSLILENLKNDVCLENVYNNLEGLEENLEINNEKNLIISNNDCHNYDNEFFKQGIDYENIKKNDKIHQHVYQKKNFFQSKFHINKKQNKRKDTQQIYNQKMINKSDYEDVSNKTK